MAAEDEDLKAGFYGEAFERFEKWGETSVRWRLSSGELVPKDREAALVWLGERDSREISNANRRANVAIVISAISAAAAVAAAAAAIRLMSHSG
jgi:hypothetical protein